MKKVLKRILIMWSVSILFLNIFATYSFSSKQKSFKIATTTSIYDSGFLSFIMPNFEKKHSIKLEFISVGSGQAVKLFENKDVDGVIIHEKSFLDNLMAKKKINGYIPFVSNHFLLVGPKGEKDIFKGVKSIKDAFLIIKKMNLKFVSRKDNSATYIRELEIWKMANTKPDFKNYIKSGQGMGLSLNLANEKNAYILTDDATYYKMRDKLNNLDVVYKNYKEPILNNIYYFAYSVSKKELSVFESFLKSDEFKSLVEDFNKKYFKTDIYTVTKYH